MRHVRPGGIQIFDKYIFLQTSLVLQVRLAPLCKEATEETGHAMYV